MMIKISDTRLNSLIELYNFVHVAERFILPIDVIRSNIHLFGEEEWFTVSCCQNVDESFILEYIENLDATGLISNVGVTISDELKSELTLRAKK